MSEYDDLKGKRVFCDDPITLQELKPGETEDYWPVLVLASDFDSLAAELAEYKEGVRECMSDHATTLERLADAEACIGVARGALHGEGVEDQGQAWDKALKTLDAYRTADSADEVRKPEPIHRTEWVWEEGGITPEEARAALTVSEVPK